VRSCRTASLVGSVALVVGGVVGTVGARRERATFDIPPVTTAVAPPPSASPAPAIDAATDHASVGTLLTAPTAADPPVNASFIDAPANVDATLCS